MREDEKVESHLSYYATKADLKNAADVDTSDFAKNADLTSLKSEMDNWDIDKFKTTPFDLNKLSDKIKNQVVKKTGFDKLVKKSNAIKTTDTSNLVEKADYNAKIGEIEKTKLDHYHNKKNITT